MPHYITITNKCRSAKIHCAISWNGIQQDFRNDLRSKDGYEEFELRDIGWHDLTIVMGAPDNRFRSEDNNRIDIGRLLAQAAPVAAVVPGIGWLVAGVGTAVALTLDQTGTKSVYSLTVGNGGPGSGSKIVRIKEGVQLEAYPISIKGLYTPYGHDIVVTGGDIHGEEQSDGSYLITGMDPLRAHWKNRTNGNQQDYVGSKP